MSLTIQKANFWKRISAYLFDLIITVVLTVGFAAILSTAMGYDAHNAKLQTHYRQYQTKYEQEYGVDFDMTQEAFDKLTQEEKDNFQAAQKAFNDSFTKDEQVLKIYQTLFYLSLVIVGIGVLFGVLIVQFVTPLFFKNGQTLGKKIFGIAVMRSNCVKISNPVLFIRVIFGQYTIETMFPLVLLIMIYFGLMGIVGTITIGLLLLLQIGVLLSSKYNSSIHDLLADSIVVDMASQRIFDSQDALLAFQEESHAAESAQKEYA